MLLSKMLAAKLVPRGKSRRRTCANNFVGIVLFMACRFCFRNSNHLESIFIHARMRFYLFVIEHLMWIDYFFFTGKEM